MIKLYFIEGLEAGKTYEFENDVISIGRSPDNDIQVKDLLVSRKHLKISMKDDEYTIMDLKSSNGTLVVKKQIPPEIEFEVEKGIPIRIGVTVLSVGKLWDNKEQSDFNSTLAPHYKDLDYKATEEKRLMTLKNNMDLVYKISNLFKEFSDLKEALNKALILIFGVLKRIDRGLIILIDHEKGEVSDIIFESKKDFSNNDMNYNEDLVNQVIRDKNEVMISDVHSEDDMGLSDTLKLIKTASVMCLPLIGCSKLQGIIYIDTLEKSHGFRVDDLGLLNALSVPIALAIESSRYH